MVNKFKVGDRIVSVHGRVLDVLAVDGDVTWGKDPELSTWQYVTLNKESQELWDVQKAIPGPIQVGDTIVEKGLTLQQAAWAYQVLAIDNKALFLKVIKAPVGGSGHRAFVDDGSWDIVDRPVAKKPFPQVGDYFEYTWDGEDEGDRDLRRIVEVMEHDVLYVNETTETFYDPYTASKSEIKQVFPNG